MRYDWQDAVDRALRFDAIVQGQFYPPENRLDPEFTDPNAENTGGERTATPERQDAQFNEADHPRDAEGKFSLTAEGAQAHVDTLASKYPDASHGGAITVELDDTRGEFAVASHMGGRIVISPSHWVPEFLEKHAKEWEGMVHDASPQGIVEHEFGHALAGKLEKKIDPEFVYDTVYKWLGVGEGESVAISNDQTSIYGQENVFEFLAESFVLFNSGGEKASVAKEHPFHEKIQRIATGVWTELLAEAAGPRLPKTAKSARYIASQYDLSEYATERLEAAFALLEDSTQRGDGKHKTRLKRELAERRKEGSSHLHPDVRQMQTRTMTELEETFPGVKPRVVYEARNNPTYDPWDNEIKLPTYGKDKSLAEVDRAEDAANEADYVINAGLRGTLMHEYGHAIDHHIIKHASEDLKDEWFTKKRALTQEIGASSPYAATKSQEWLPERLTAELLGKEPKALIPILQEYLGKVGKGRADAQFVEADHPRDETGQFTEGGGGGGAAAPSAPKLPPIAKTKEAKARYEEIKELADRVESAIANKLPQALDHIPMHRLQSALNDLWDTRMPESGRLSKADQKLNDALRAEVTRRFERDKNEREARADSYAYMSDEEFHASTGVNFGGDSRMKPGIKAQLGRLPPSHLKYLKHNSMSVRAVQEIERLSESHAYAPGMQPAGLFTPREGKIEVADHITLPDGSKRMLYSRAQTLRHEVGHAIDEITGLSHDPDFLQAVSAGIAKMTPEERRAAAYYLGEKYNITDADRINARRLETFAEIYAYAYSDGADPDEEGGTFGGMSQQRRFELFGKARQVMRSKLAEWTGDRRLDHQREAA